jgi:GNAT superfamily N-acetyltransferase
MVTLRKALESDCPTIHRIQVKSFSPLLAVYQDYASSPAAESLEQVLRRFAQSFTDYYLICLDETPVGMIRVCDFGEECRVSPVCMLPEYQGRGLARAAMLRAETLYPAAKRWSLDTIAQEAGLCRFYESLGYRLTGKTERIKEGMDLVYYRKDVKSDA